MASGPSRVGALVVAASIAIATGCASSRYQVPGSTTPATYDLAMSCRAGCESRHGGGSDDYFSCLETCPGFEVDDGSCGSGKPRHCEQKSRVSRGAVVGVVLVATLVSVLFWAVLSLDSDGVSYGGN